MKGRLGSWAGLALGPYWKHPGAFLSDRLGLSTSFSLGTKGVDTVKCMWCAPQLVTLPAPLVHPEGHWTGGCCCLQKQAEVAQDSLTMLLPGCLSREKSSPPRGERQGEGEGGGQPRAGSRIPGEVVSCARSLTHVIPSTIQRPHLFCRLVIPCKVHS